jgi:translation initiation factor 1A
MPKNKGKGGRAVKRGTGNKNLDQSSELVFKEDLQEYGYVTAVLGNGRLQVRCYDGTPRMARIRGKMHKKVWINNNDTVLVALREFEDKKADVILKYNDDEVRRLRILKELPDLNKFDGEGNRSDLEDDRPPFEFDISEL